MTLPLENLFCLSFSAHDGHPTALRETVCFNDRSPAVFTEWLEKLPDEGVSLVYLATCHRIEIYGYGVDPYKILQQWLALKGTKVEQAKIIRRMDVVEHLVRVIASLESEVLGETQIAGQVRDTVERHRKLRLLHGVLDRIFQFSFKVAKQVRHESNLGKGTISVAHVAIDGIFDFFESLEKKSSLVVGAGPMAMQSIERLRNLGLRDITWANRSLDKIQQSPLAAFCKTVALERLPELVLTRDISIFALGTDRVFLKTECLEKAGLSYNQKERLILDLGLPRNVDPHLHTKNGIFLRDVDEFNNRAQRGKKSRKAEIEHAQTMIERALSEFEELWAQWSRSSQMAQLYENVESLRVETLAEQKFTENREITTCTKAISAKLLHRLSRGLKHIDEPYATQFLDILLNAWDGGELKNYGRSKES